MTAITSTAAAQAVEEDRGTDVAAGEAGKEGGGVHEALG